MFLLVLSGGKGLTGTVLPLLGLESGVRNMPVSFSPLLLAQEMNSCVLCAGTAREGKMTVEKIRWEGELTLRSDPSLVFHQELVSISLPLAYG